MQQTMLALFAMMTVTLLSVNQQRTLLEGRKAMLDDEMEVMASGIGLQAMEFIRTKAFDEATKSETRKASDAEGFSRSFPRQRKCTLLSAREGDKDYEACDDLSDFHDMQWEKMPFVIGSDTVHFAVKAEVFYLDDQRRRTTSPTFQKEVVVTVRHLPRNDGLVLLRKPLRITRTVAY